MSGGEAGELQDGPVRTELRRSLGLRRVEKKSVLVVVVAVQGVPVTVVEVVDVVVVLDALVAAVLAVLVLLDGVLSSGVLFGGGGHDRSFLAVVPAGVADDL